MGAQDEYLRNFSILLTDKGIVPLTDPLQIAVYDSLKEGMKRPTDLSIELGMGSSSLHFIIDKMIESGIVCKTKPDSDKKVVYYSTSAIKILESKDASKDNIEATDAFSKGRSGLSSVLESFDQYMDEIGVDTTPLKLEYTVAFANSIEVEKMSLEDASLKARDCLNKYTGYTFTVFSFSPFTLVFSGGEDVKEMSKYLSHFVLKIISNATDRDYKAVEFSNFNGREDMIKVAVECHDKSDGRYINTSLVHSDEQKFIMLDLDGAAGIMTSDVQISILDAMYERPICITDIVSKVDAPRSTITSNLLRMVEEGVISVFYSESGSAYYGLASSILLKKVNPMDISTSALNEVLSNVKSKDGAFKEGFFPYALTQLKGLGFETECLMIVLGARYMRSCETSTPSSFDNYFGKMSEVAESVGLSLNIVSVYPLTIGITVTSESVDSSNEITFIKGMAHQGLEMASKGIFVRNSESDAEEKISFKEIYPALSMTPVKGITVDDVATKATSTKKRTSSVKTALLNRSSKETGKPERTVRYITGLAFMLLFAAVIAMGAVGVEDVDGNTVTLSVDDGITVYDAEGFEITSNVFEVNGTVYLKTIGNMDIGYITGGIAYKMTPNANGIYTLTLDSDKRIEQLYDASRLMNMACEFSVYSADKTVSLANDIVTIDSMDYMEASNGMYVSYNNVIKVNAINGCSLLMAGMVSDTIESRNLEFQSIDVTATPVTVKTIYLGDNEYNYSGHVVKGVLEVEMSIPYIELQFVADKNVSVFVNGTKVFMDADNHFTLDLTETNVIVLTVVESGLY